MKTSTLRYCFSLQNFNSHAANSPSFIPIKALQSYLKHSTKVSVSSTLSKSGSFSGQLLPYQTETSYVEKPLTTRLLSKRQNHLKEEFHLALPDGHSRYVIVGAVSIGLVLLLMGMDDQKAMALGPEGPLMEEFWDNVRRYALYFLTVSTGAIYTIFQPIYELLKNPISAILILTILGGGFFIVSQVVSAMVGISDFNYEYGY